MPTTNTARMMQIAADLEDEGLYTSANSIRALTAERDAALQESYTMIRKTLKLLESLRLRRAVFYPLNYGDIAAKSNTCKKVSNDCLLSVLLESAFAEALGSKDRTHKKSDGRIWYSAMIALNPFRLISHRAIRGLRRAFL